MADPPAGTSATEECPHCHKTARREETEVGIFVVCDHCGFEAAEQLRLDFKSD